MSQLFRLCHQTDGSPIQNLPNRLYLRQNHTPFRSRFVNGSDQKHHVLRSEQAAEQTGRRSLFGMLLVEFSQLFLECLDTLSGSGTDSNAGFRNAVCDVTLVPNLQHRNLLLFQLLQNGAVCFSHAGGSIDYQHSQICVGKCPPCLLYPQFSQCAGVVQTGGVDQHNGSDRQQFHCFFHGVCGGAADRGNHRDRLSGNGVNQAGLTGIPPPEKANVYPIGTGCLVAVLFHKRFSLKPEISCPLQDFTQIGFGFGTDVFVGDLQKLPL